VTALDGQAGRVPDLADPRSGAWEHRQLDQPEQGFAPSPARRGTVRILVRNSQGLADSVKERIIPSRSTVLHSSAKACRRHGGPGDAVALRVSRFA
jgi:hypothetical protein